MKTKHRHLFIALASPALATLNSQFSIVFAQGNLTPPGAPTPTMKTLAQIEPRTPISSLPFTISSPGAYYLTANLAGTAGQNGINVNTSDVTIDLMGFCLTGTTNASYYGISAGMGVNNVRVNNGTFRFWGIGVALGSPVNNSQLDRLRAFDNLSSGFVTGAGSTVKDCVAERNGNNGIAVGDGCLVSGCVARTNVNNGIFAGSSVTIMDCVVQTNGADGIQASGPAVISGCVATANGADGVYAANNCIMNHCQATFNSGRGIDVGNNCVLTDNNCFYNGYYGGFGSYPGIDVIGNSGRIEGNNCVSNGFYGIAVRGTSTGNVIIHNSARGNGTQNYLIVGGNDLGPTTSSAVTATSPWANFSY